MRNPNWRKTVLTVLASWPTTLRAGFLITLLALTLWLLTLHISVGPVHLGGRWRGGDGEQVVHGERVVLTAGSAEGRTQPADEQRE
jgi:hypothetical protein